MGSVLTRSCCCKDSNIENVSRKISKEGPAPQHRANLQIKSGGFSVGAFVASNRGKVEDHYELEKKVIGEGSYGSVVRCTNKETSQMRALKTISHAVIGSQSDQFKEEMAIMKLLDHPNIVRLYETFEDARNIYLVLELCTGGELFDRIVEVGNFTEKVAVLVVQQMLRAINYMHLNYIMHRDLKPENWLLASDESMDKSSLKLIDFGLSKRFEPGQFASTRAGTPYYVAPEVLDGRYAEKSDVWSIGVIMYIMLCGSPPFTGNETVAVLDAVRRARPTFDRESWKGISAEAKQLLKSLLTKDPSSRLTAANALKHPWMAAEWASQNTALDQNSKAGGLAISSLKNFAGMNKLKKAALNVIATQLTDHAIADLKKLFTAMDENGDGTLSVEELQDGLKRAGVDIPPDLQMTMESIDTDGSGVIDYSEFIAATLDKRKYYQDDVCWSAFKVFDQDGSGAIDRAELVKVLMSEQVTDLTKVKMVEEEINLLVTEIDLNGDGKIDFDEFMAMMRMVPTGDDKGERTDKLRTTANKEVKKTMSESRKSKTTLKGPQ